MPIGGIANFVIQGGGFYVTNRFTANPSFATIGTFAPITNEVNVGTFYSHTYETIAMAKTGDPNSATSQVFFNLANHSASLDNPFNTGGFTVFGRVVGGTTVLSFVDGRAPYRKIHWGGNNPPGSLALQKDPPAGYDYKWSGD